MRAGRPRSGGAPSGLTVEGVWRAISQESLLQHSTGKSVMGREKGQGIESQVRSVPEWPQEAQKLESAGLKSHSGIGVHRTRLSVERPQKAQKPDWARLEPYFVTFVLFVVEPFTPLAG